MVNDGMLMTEKGSQQKYKNLKASTFANVSQTGLKFVPCSLQRPENNKRNKTLTRKLLHNNYK